MTKEHFDIHQHVTDRIIAAIDAGASRWQMPWRRRSGNRGRTNVASRNPYTGMNVLALWVDAQTNDYSSHLWGTFRQWSDKGATVKKGQKASYIIFYPENALDTEEDDGNESSRRLIARATPVFNAAKVGGFAAAERVGDPLIHLEDVERFVEATQAPVLYGGGRVCFVPSRDAVHMPERTALVGSVTCAATDAYYSTLLHELTHWTAPPHLCDRDLSGRFGSDAYPWKNWSQDSGPLFCAANSASPSSPGRIMLNTSPTG